jgi:hypothetical protein
MNAYASRDDDEDDDGNDDNGSGGRCAAGVAACGGCSCGAGSREARASWRRRRRSPADAPMAPSSREAGMEAASWGRGVGRRVGGAFLLSQWK